MATPDGKLECNESFWWDGLEIIAPRPKLGLLGAFFDSTMTEELQSPNGEEQEEEESSEENNSSSTTSSCSASTSECSEESSPPPAKVTQKKNNLFVTKMKVMDKVATYVLDVNWFYFCLNDDNW